MTENNKKKTEDCRHQWAPLMAKAGKKTLPSLVNVCLRCGELKVGQRTIRMSRYRLDMGGKPIKNTSTRWGPGNMEWEANKLLKGAGVGADPAEIDVPAETGNSILEKLQKHLGVWWFNNNWLPAGMISNAISGSGSFTWSVKDVESNTGITSDSYAGLTKEAVGLGSVASWAKKRFFGVYVYFGFYSAQNIHITSGACPNTGAANTGRHIGFKLIDDALYGTVADGTTEATHLLETLTAAVYTRLECVLTPGVECRFYVDGVDKGAITTNLPTTTSYARFLFKSTVHNTAAANKGFMLFEARTFQEE